MLMMRSNDYNGDNDIFLQAFQELQVKVIDTTQKVKIAEMQIEQLKRANQHAKLTDLEIGVLPPDTKTYEAIGRMYEYSIIMIFVDY